MISKNPEQQNGVGRLPRGPYLSHSRINRYLHCPEQYRLYYVERLRPKTPAASRVFGQVVHQVLARHFKTGDDPGALFEQLWQELQREELRYGSRESWERLRDQGRQLLATFLAQARPRLTKITSVEETFMLMVTSLNVPLVGVVDLVADLDSKPTVVDFKTSGAS